MEPLVSPLAEIQRNLIYLLGWSLWLSLLLLMGLYVIMGVSLCSGSLAIRMSTRQWIASLLKGCRICACLSLLLVLACLPGRFVNRTMVYESLLFVYVFMAHVMIWITCLSLLLAAFLIVIKAGFFCFGNEEIREEASRRISPIIRWSLLSAGTSAVLVLTSSLLLDLADHLLG